MSSSGHAAKRIERTPRQDCPRAARGLRKRFARASCNLRCAWRTDSGSFCRTRGCAVSAMRSVDVNMKNAAWRIVLAIVIAASSWSAASYAQEGGYALNPGDVLQVAVWKDTELTREILVRPDGRITFPLVGDIQAAGQT